LESKKEKVAGLKGREVVGNVGCVTPSPRGEKKSPYNYVISKSIAMFSVGLKSKS